MFNHYANHPLSSVPEVFALAVSSIYLLYAAFCYSDVLSPRAHFSFFGLLACWVLVFNFRSWRSTILLASSDYLLLFGLSTALLIRIVRMSRSQRSLIPICALLLLQCFGAPGCRRVSREGLLGWFDTWRSRIRHAHDSRRSYLACSDIVATEVSGAGLRRKTVETYLPR